MIFDRIRTVEAATASCQDRTAYFIEVLQRVGKAGRGYSDTVRRLREYPCPLLVLFLKTDAPRVPSRSTPSHSCSSAGMMQSPRLRRLSPSSSGREASYELCQGRVHVTVPLPPEPILLVFELYTSSLYPPHSVARKRITVQPLCLDSTSQKL